MRFKKKKNRKKETLVSTALVGVSVSGWGCCIILDVYRSSSSFHPFCVPTPPGFRSLCLTQTCWKYLVQIKIRAPERLKAPGSVLYFTNSLFFFFFSFFPVLCQIVNRQMEPFRPRGSCVNIELGSVDTGGRESDDHTWSGGLGVKEGCTAANRSKHSHWGKICCGCFFV